MAQEAITEFDMDIFSRRIGPYFTWLESKIESGWQQSDSVPKDVLKETRYLATNMRARFILGIPKQDFALEVKRVLDLFELAMEAFPEEAEEVETKVRHFCKGIAEELGAEFLPQEYKPATTITVTAETTVKIEPKPVLHAEPRAVKKEEPKVVKEVKTEIKPLLKESSAPKTKIVKEAKPKALPVKKEVKAAVKPIKKEAPKLKVQKPKKAEPAKKEPAKQEQKKGGFGTFLKKFIRIDLQ